FTPKTPWLHYAGNPVAPLRRKRNGAYMPEIHTRPSTQRDLRRVGFFEPSPSTQLSPSFC
ncbi:hypothetical protein ABH944_007424, partial [Caballeronia udeis]